MSPANGSDPAKEPGQVTAAPGSALAGLRARRAAAREGLHLDVAVPRYDPPIWVRFRPLTAAEINRLAARLEKSKAEDKVVVMNATALATACQGLFEVDAETGEKRGLDPNSTAWPIFDAGLAELLGFEASAGADVVRGVYATDLDVLAVAGHLTQWSGQSEEQLAEATAGN